MPRPPKLTLQVATTMHFCPFKLRDVSLAHCYIDSNDVKADACYACPHVPVLKEQYGLRTFRRRLAINRCGHCHEPASEHSDIEPYRGLRNNCPGFKEDYPDIPLYVPTNEACTTWMVVMSVTGHRMTLAEYRERRLKQRDPGMRAVMRESRADVARLKLPLVGQPETASAMEAAERAERERLGYDRSKRDDEGNLIKPRKRGKQKEQK
jgi:hypothetical protein